MTYSKSRVDRAGRLLAEGISQVLEGTPPSPEHREEVVQAIEVIEWWRGEHAKPLSRVAANLRHYTAKEGKPVVAQRLKRVPTIAGKLLREPAMKLSRMADIGGVRAVLPTQAAAYRTASDLRRNWTITKTRDYVETPKSDGYRALHLINRHRGRLIEIQLRTPHQDRWANAVESFSRAFPGLKDGAGPPILREHFILVSEFFSMRDEDLAPPVGLISRLEDSFSRVDTFLESAS